MTCLRDAERSEQKICTEGGQCVRVCVCVCVCEEIAHWPHRGTVAVMGLHSEARGVTTDFLVPWSRQAEKVVSLCCSSRLCGCDPLNLNPPPPLIHTSHQTLHTTMDLLLLLEEGVRIPCGRSPGSHETVPQHQRLTHHCCHPYTVEVRHWELVFSSPLSRLVEIRSEVNQDLTCGFHPDWLRRGGEQQQQKGLLVFSKKSVTPHEKNTYILQPVEDDRCVF
ncbi:hypothetical protein INR49_016710 [Caranx melampygus]|nr:hypothetical protein INR49_016710 [Caranx melampygus]